jgi:hypothetical protein
MLKGMVRPEGLEPPAYWFEASRSIQLSYRRTSMNHCQPQYLTFNSSSQALESAVVTDGRRTAAPSIGPSGLQTHR